MLIAAAACSGGDSSSEAPTSGPRQTTATTAASTPEKTAFNEARAIIDALHEARPEFCKTPNWETNISLPAEQRIPIPVTRGTCVFDRNRVQVVALARPTDRETYIERWTARLCDLSNQGTLRLLPATYWVVNDHTVTILPRRTVAETVASIVGGTVHQQDCP
jgi:hypothetical protein